MKLSRSLGPLATTLGTAALLLYLWLRYFSYREEQPAVFIGTLGIPLLSGGFFFLIYSQFERRWRTPARFLRWNAIVALIGIGHLLIWGLLLLWLSPEAERGQALSSGLIEVGLSIQAAGHAALAGHLLGVRLRREKVLVIVGYFVLLTGILFLRGSGFVIGAFLTPLLWAGILPLLYFSEWLQAVAERQIPEALLLITGTTAILFAEWQMVLPMVFSSYPPLLKAMYPLLIAIVLLHGGWLMVPILLRLSRFSREGGAAVEILTEFLAQQHRSENPQAVLNLSKETLRRLQPVGHVFLWLRPSPEEEYVATTLPVGGLQEGIKKLFLQRSGTETYTEVVPSLRKLGRTLPDVSAILVQRPMRRLSGSFLIQTLHAVVLGVTVDGFEERDIELIIALIEQTALFLEHLEQRGYQEQILTARKEADFLKETREALLPPPPPILKKVDYHVHFEQYDRTIGGDYYQIHEYPNGEVVDFWLSDSAGSGIAAAYQMAQARAVLNALWMDVRPPDDLIFRLNDTLKKLFHKNNFLAATLLRFDLRKKEYILYRAGNPEIFYWNPLTDTVDVLRPSGIVLGNASSQIIGRILIPETGRLLPGSLFLFFSDGFSEASNLSGEMFGMERLLAAFQKMCHATPKEIAQYIVEEVRAFTGGTSLGDDGTLIVVRYLG